MANFKSKLATPKRARRNANKQVFRFPTIRGKTLKTVEFWTYAEGHTIALHFTDKTSLDFRLDPGFTLEVTHSKWKTGNQRIMKRWPLMRSAPGGV